MRCLSLDFEDTDRNASKRADKLLDEQLPNRKDIFHVTNKQKEEREKTIKNTNQLITKFENQMNEPLQRYSTISKNATFREEFVKCGKENCNDCPH